MAQEQNWDSLSGMITRYTVLVFAVTIIHLYVNEICENWKALKSKQNENIIELCNNHAQEVIHLDNY